MANGSKKLDTANLACPVAYSVYPTERDEIIRLQRELKLRTPFDVIRRALLASGLPRSGKIREPKS